MQPRIWTRNRVQIHRFEMGRKAGAMEVLVGALSVPVALAVLAECPAELGLEVRLGATDQQAGLDGGERACHGGARSKIKVKQC